MKCEKSTNLNTRISPADPSDVQDAIRALVRLLARQAARDVLNVSFESPSTNNVATPSSEQEDG